MSVRHVSLGGAHLFKRTLLFAVIFTEESVNDGYVAPTNSHNHSTRTLRPGSPAVSKSSNTSIQRQEFLFLWQQAQTHHVHDSLRIFLPHS